MKLHFEPFQYGFRYQYQNHLILAALIFQNDINFKTNILLHKPSKRLALNWCKIPTCRSLKSISKPISINSLFRKSILWLFRNQFRFNIDLFGKFRHQNQYWLLNQLVSHSSDSQHHTYCLYLLLT